MAAELRAPRTARPDFDMDAAALARAVATGDGGGALLDFSMNGASPFGASPLDAAQAITGQLAALLKVLGAAHADLDTAERGGVFAQEMATVEGSVQSAAYDGLSSLASLAAFFLDQHRGAQ